MPDVAIITGSAGLVGSEAALHFGGRGLDISGVDNDMRAAFFGEEASTRWNRRHLQEALGRGYRHFDLDVRDRDGIKKLFRYHGKQIGLVIHAAAQPSHDWAAREPIVDFDVNACGTLNVLEATRLYAPEAVVIFTSTNKVYGDTPNRLPLVEAETRWEIEPGHTYAAGIREDMSIDHTLHSLFGVSKVAADLLTQEYGRYFDLRTACFRAGTLTGPQHAATELHGFLAYVMRSLVEGRHYRIFGYKGKQVRDAIHSADLVSAFDEFFRAPRSGGQVYNIGGGRMSNVSVIEAIRLSEEIAGRTLDWSYCDENRVGDHMWWISDNGRFEGHFPDWKMTYDAPRILSEIHEFAVERVGAAASKTVTSPR